jgi:hypothetical protein
MNNRQSPMPNRILPLFLLSGLLTVSSSLLPGCSASKPETVKAPEPVAEPEPVVEQAPVEEKEIRVKAEHPRKYTVKKGDTLWDISSLFLQDPWYWPEIWSRNEQIKNPHLIFPGDVLTLVYVNGQPQIRVNDERRQEIARAAREGGMPVKKLSPSIRETSLDASIPTIPGDAIRQFLTKPRVVTKEQLDNAPRIIGSEGSHLILGQGSRVYVRGEIDKERVRFSVFKPGDELRDPQSNELLGYEAKYSGELRIVDYADPASADLEFTEREVLIGDRLLPEDKSKMENLYFPHIPDIDIDGQIISLYDALFGVAQYQIVVLNKGELDGLEVGHLLATYTQGATVRDRFDPKRSEPVKLPNERSGLVMIFKTFERVSYALVLESRRVIHKLDYFHTPRR